MADDMVSTTLYPFAAPTMARAIPVLPLVDSRMTLSGVKAPDASACSINDSAIRSFTLPLGLDPSSLAKILMRELS